MLEIVWAVCVRSAVWCLQVRVTTWAQVLRCAQIKLGAWWGFMPVACSPKAFSRVLLAGGAAHDRIRSSLRTPPVGTCTTCTHTHTHMCTCTDTLHLPVQELTGFVACLPAAAAAHSRTIKTIR